MDLAELTAAVDRAFERTSEGLAPWPDPRPDGRAPAEEEYDRCPDPGKYRLLLARADAWAAALVDLGLGTEREVPAAALREVRDGRRPARGALVEPTTDGAAPLLFLSWEEAEDAAARVEVQLQDLGLLVVGAPACGCDACDDGSDRQLAEIDRAIGSVAAGEWLHLELHGARITATADAWSADGRVRAREVTRLVEEARAGRSSHPVVQPGRWW